MGSVLSADSCPHPCCGGWKAPEAHSDCHILKPTFPICRLTCLKIVCLSLCGKGNIFQDANSKEREVAGFR